MYAVFNAQSTRLLMNEFVGILAEYTMCHICEILQYPSLSSLLCTRGGGSTTLGSKGKPHSLSLYIYIYVCVKHIDRQAANLTEQ